MRQLKVIHISWCKCDMSRHYLVSQSNILEKQLGSMSDNECGMSRSNLPLSVCFCVPVSHKPSHLYAGLFIFRTVSVVICLQARTYHERNNGFVLKCCIPHHYTSTSSHAKKPLLYQKCALHAHFIVHVRTEELASTERLI